MFTKSYKHCKIQHNIRSMSTIVCIGGGSMASLFTAKLSLHNTNTTVYMLTGKRQHTETVKQHGLQFQAINSTTIQHCNVKIAHNVSDVTATDITLILLYIKAVGHLVDTAAQQCKQLIQQCTHTKPTVLTMMNGVGHHETLCTALNDVLPQSHILVGSTSCAAVIDTPGTVRQTGHSPVTIIANDTDHSQMAQELATLLSHSGFDTLTAPLSSKTMILWTKLLYNTTINPLATILQVKNECLQHEAHKPILTQLVNEFIDVCAAANIQLDFDIPKNSTLQHVALNSVYAIIERTKNNINSTLADVLAKRPTENELLLGTVIRTAQQYNVAVPYMQCCYNLIHAKEANYKYVLH